MRRARCLPPGPPGILQSVPLRRMPGGPGGKARHFTWDCTGGGQGAARGGRGGYLGWCRGVPLKKKVVSLAELCILRGCFVSDCQKASRGRAPIFPKIKVAVEPTPPGGENFEK